MPSYTQPRKTWQYSNDFKVKAVQLTYQAGIQVQQVAKGLDIHPMMLSRWRKEYREGLLSSDGKKRVGVMKDKITTNAKELKMNLQVSIFRLGKIIREEYLSIEQT